MNLTYPRRFWHTLLTALVRVLATPSSASLSPGTPLMGGGRTVAAWIVEYTKLEQKLNTKADTKSIESRHRGE